MYSTVCLQGETEQILVLDLVHALIDALVMGRSGHVGKFGLMLDVTKAIYA